MGYEMFISYSSSDRVWAEKLEADLRSRGVDCFLDRKRLTGGSKWQPQLLDALVESRHFIVLWSANARESDWVLEELTRFKSHIDPTGTGPVKGRLLYAINLKGHNATLATFQQFVEPKVQAVYDEWLAGKAIDLATNGAQAAWDGWVSEMTAAAKAADPAVSVPVGVLALTTETLQKSPVTMPDFDFVSSHDVDSFLQSVGLGRSQDLAARYGSTPFDWRPFGTETVRALLDQLLSDPKTGINAKLAALRRPPLHWSPVDLLTPPVNVLAESANALASGPALVIVDPISLFSLKVWQRYVTIGRCFSNPQAAIVFLTPFEDNKEVTLLRKCLAEQGRPNLDWFHDPIPFDPGYANCGVTVADRWEVRRLVLASLGRAPSATAARSANALVNG
jgi:hypothetical protein